MRYDPEALKPALTELLQVMPPLRASASYRYDLTDLTRQVLANESRRLLPQIRSAYESKDRDAFKKLTDQWMNAMTWEDRLLNTNEYFLLGRWLSYLPAWSSSTADRAQIEYDANDDWPKKWLLSGDPSSRRSDVVPSARPPRSTSGPRSRQ